MQMHRSIIQRPNHPTRKGNIVITAEQVRAFVAAQFEDTEPHETIMGLIRAEEGKKITKRFLAKLPGGADGWYLNIDKFSARLESRSYLHTHGREGVSYSLVGSVWGKPKDAIVFSATLFEKENPSYFKGRWERNAERLKIMNDLNACARIAQRLNRLASAHEELGASEEAFASETLECPDRREMRTLAGIE